jgi:hypothetical protein
VVLTVSGAWAAARYGSIIERGAFAALGQGVIIAGLGLMVASWLAERAVTMPADWPDAQYAVEVRSFWDRRVVLGAPATAVSRAVDFSNDRRHGDDDASWRTYTFSRESYAQQFAELNAARLYRAGT